MLQQLFKHSLPCVVAASHAGFAQTGDFPCQHISVQRRSGFLRIFPIKQQIVPNLDPNQFIRVLRFQIDVFIHIGSEAGFIVGLLGVFADLMDNGMTAIIQEPFKLATEHLCGGLGQIRECVINVVLAYAVNDDLAGYSINEVFHRVPNAVFFPAGGVPNHFHIFRRTRPGGFRRRGYLCIGLRLLCLQSVHGGWLMGKTIKFQLPEATINGRYFLPGPKTHILLVSHTKSLVICGVVCHAIPRSAY